MKSINLPVATPSTAAPPAGRVALNDSDLHVLRLCLDLQLDALLLAVGAASQEPSRSGPPWRRWVDEDILLARDIATDAQTGGDGPPSGLGSDLNGSVPFATEKGLHARYTAMAALLSGLISRPRPDHVDQAGPRREDAPGPARTLKHCQDRLAELEAHPWRRPPVDTGGSPTERAYLPGELLG
jgi:hypothetical protein